MTDTKASTFTSGIAVLSEDEPAWDDGPFPVRGVALPEDIVTAANSDGTPVYWPPDVVESLTTHFEGAKITDPSEHDPETVIERPQPSPETIIGEITTARYEPGVGVLFEGEVDDVEIAKRIQRGRVDVSPVIFRTLGEETVDVAGDTPARIPDEIVGVRDLSVVADGAAEGNRIEPATAAMSALSATALSAAFDESGAEVLQDTEIHEPEWTDTREAPWNAPGLEDFTDESWDDLPADEKQQIAEHFIGSRTGFPPENFGDLFLPVVDSENNLVLNALQNAKARLGQVEGLSDDQEDRVESMLNRLANENYENADFGAETNAAPPGDDGGSQSTDGPADATESTADQPDSSHMSENEPNLSDAERELLAAADDPAQATEVLQDYQSREEPRIVEADEWTAHEERVETLEQIMNDRLIEDKNLREATVEAMSFEAKAAEFENDDGEFDAETLVQVPETGSASSGDDPRESDDAVAEVLEEYNADDVDEAVEVLKKRHTRFSDMGWESHAQDAADKLDTLGVEV